MKKFKAAQAAKKQADEVKEMTNKVSGLKMDEIRKEADKVLGKLGEQVSKKFSNINLDMNSLKNIGDSIPKELNFAGLKMETFDNPIIDSAKHFANQHLDKVGMNVDNVVDMAKNVDIGGLFDNLKSGGEALLGGMNNDIAEEAKKQVEKINAELLKGAFSDMFGK